MAHCILVVPWVAKYFPIKLPVSDLIASVVRPSACPLNGECVSQVNSAMDIYTCSLRGIPWAGDDRSNVQNFKHVYDSAYIIRSTVAGARRLWSSEVTWQPMARFVRPIYWEVN